MATVRQTPLKHQNLITSTTLPYSCGTLVIPVVLFKVYIKI